MRRERERERGGKDRRKREGEDGEIKKKRRGFYNCRYIGVLLS